MFKVIPLAFLNSMPTSPATRDQLNIKLSNLKHSNYCSRAIVPSFPNLRDASIASLLLRLWLFRCLLPSAYCLLIWLKIHHLSLFPIFSFYRAIVLSCRRAVVPSFPPPHPVRNISPWHRPASWFQVPAPPVQG